MKRKQDECIDLTDSPQKRTKNTLSVDNSKPVNNDLPESSHDNNTPNRDIIQQVQ